VNQGCKGGRVQQLVKTYAQGYCGESRGRKEGILKKESRGGRQHTHVKRRKRIHSRLQEGSRGGNLRGTGSDVRGFGGGRVSGGGVGGGGGGWGRTGGRWWGGGKAVGRGWGGGRGWGLRGKVGPGRAVTMCNWCLRVMRIERS